MKIGIFHPTDIAGHVPGGIDTFIRGLMRWAPPDLQYVLFGATSDEVARPIGELRELQVGSGVLKYLPLVGADPRGHRSHIPLSVRYVASLRRSTRSGLLSDLAVLDFHRLETALAFHFDHRPRNLFIHLDMAILRDVNCDIGWRRAPWLYEYLEGKAFTRLNRVFTVRQSAVDRYRATYPRMAEKFAFVPTWVEPETFFPTSREDRDAVRSKLAAEFALPVDCPRLVFVGRLDRQKDPLLLLEAFKRVLARQPSTRLVMIGDGILRPEIERAISSGPLAGQVILTGALPPVRIADFLRSSEAFVLTSAYEGMPIVVLEALACGTPVVTTDVGEVKRVVRDEVNGRVVVQRTPEAVGDALLDVLQKREWYAGVPCLEAAALFTPQKVLSRIYDNHREQARR